MTFPQTRIDSPRYFTSSTRPLTPMTRLLLILIVILIVPTLSACVGNASQTDLNPSQAALETIHPEQTTQAHDTETHDPISLTTQTDTQIAASISDPTPLTSASTITTAITARPQHLSLEADTTSPWQAMVEPGENNARDELLDAQHETLAESDTPSIDPEPHNVDDLWHRLRNGLQLSGEDHRFVRPYITWYAEHQSYLNRVVERARPFLYDIVQEIEARGMPMEIALLPVVESAFQPFAYSPGRAAGIWQFIPATGKRYGLKQNWWYDGRRDVPKATTAALDYLQRLHKRFDGDWLLALASYNSGEGRVARAVRKNKKKGIAIDFWSLDLPKETEGYVPKLLAISAIINHNEKHGITLASIPNTPHLERIDIGSQIDLALAAELAELPIDTLYKLNPAFNRWATDPNGPHVLLLPIDKAEGFREALAKVDKKQRIRWQRHEVRQGETLGHIARKYQTSIKLLQEVNDIRDKWIRTGKSIIIPVATKNLKDYLSEDRRRLALQSTKRSGYKIKHKVKSGDTFWDLSLKYKVKVSQLASWNGMSPKDALMPGQRLVIWSKHRNHANARFVAPPRNATRQQLHYRVRKGDSLARIAQKFSVSVSKLRRWNSLKEGKYLQPGQRLTLYVDVTEQS